MEEIFSTVVTCTANRKDGTHWKKPPDDCYGMDFQLWQRSWATFHSSDICDVREEVKSGESVHASRASQRIKRDACQEWEVLEATALGESRASQRSAFFCGASRSINVKPHDQQSIMASLAA